MAKFCRGFIFPMPSLDPHYTTSDIRVQEVLNEAQKGDYSHYGAALHCSGAPPRIVLRPLPFYTTIAGITFNTRVVVGH